ncbi:LysR family transcriptional regulator [Shewanella corallii]|uniref:LysR family transcriptional regulator n=1 Tax=Shewanella corallii TaxID=560080 RepID=A0ABT0N4D1_9GAMM|nr:LysR family transcriptional regulator [Shewanella corallii]MCL2913311.1 LysR family transcriptional regulator [Shewanella corallii]
MYSLEQLACFVATVEHGSFSAAARALGKVQSAVSQQVINLEIDADQNLFIREGRYPVLTDAGSQLLPYAKAVLAQQRKLEQQIQLLGNQQPAKLTLALDEGIPVRKLLHVLNEISREFPGIAIEMLAATSSDIIDLVEHGRAGTGLVFSSLEYPSSLHFDSIGTVVFDVLVGREHLLASSEAVPLEQLKLHRQLVIGSRNEIGSTFNMPLSPDVWYADNYYVLNELAISGFGWAMLPRHIAIEAVNTGKLVRVPLEAENLSWHANVDLIQHASDASTLAGRRLRQLIQGMLD